MLKKNISTPYILWKKNILTGSNTVMLKVRLFLMIRPTVSYSSVPALEEK